jgi:hypothetical protein
VFILRRRQYLTLQASNIRMIIELEKTLNETVLGQSKYYPRMSLEGPRKIANNLIQNTKHVPYTGLGLYH